MIPKIIHNIWTQGYRNLPNKNKINYMKIKKLNPNWKFIIWDECKIKKILKKYPKIEFLYKNAEKLSGIIKIESAKSDIARYLIMKEYGGLYYDFDFECISSFNKLFSQNEPANSVYIASSKINFLDYIYPFFKPKYCSCFMAMKKNHPIWNKVFTILENTRDKIKIGSALDESLQKTENKYNIVNLERVKGPYQYLNNDSICFTPVKSSWNPIRPFMKYMNYYYEYIFLFILVIINYFIILLMIKHT